jgi:hypothetical protein
MEITAVFSWKRICFLLIVLLTAQSLLFLHSWKAPTLVNSPKSSALSHRPPTSPSSQTSSLSPPSYGFGDSLTASQCSTQFPDLYFELDRAVQYWKSRNHTISPDDVDISWHSRSLFAGGALRLLIHDNRIRILHSINAMRDESYRERGLGILNLLHRALESASAAGERLPTVEAAIVLQDVSYPPTENGTHSFWTWTRRIGNATQERVWLIPNFDFWATHPLGSYQDARERAIEHDVVAVADKIPRAVWRGTVFARTQTIHGNYIRSGLVNATVGKEWADVKGRNATTGENRLALEELCDYAMTIHTEGVSYSGRLKYLLNCNALPISHELEWTAQYYHLLVKEGPRQNYVEVKKDWSDLEETVLYYLQHPEERRRIVENHLRTFREKYFTRAALSCYLRRLVQQYALVAFEPDVLKEVDGKMVLRGRSFEQFIDRPEDFDE